MGVDKEIALKEGLINSREIDKAPRLYSLSTFLRKRSPQERWEYMDEGEPLLRRVLSWVDVLSCSTCMTIGAGIFVIAGIVAHQYAGPAVVFSFLLAGASALISSLCYGEFSARVPVSGSTFSYTYISLGEFMGWMAGWISILEYTVGAAVAKEVAMLFFKIAQLFHVELWNTEPALTRANHIISTMLIVVLVILVIFGGIKGSALFCRVMAIMNVGTIMFIIASGCFFIEFENWANFFPFGFSGIIRGAARVIFAYVGFENSTTLATEVKNPQKSMPFGVIGSLALAVVVYLCSSLLITGMVNYNDLTSDTPFVDAFSENAFWIAIIVALGSLLCMTTTILSSLIGLPRILYQMAKDGLLGDSFANLNRFRVPYLGTLVIGFISCLLTIFLDFEYLSDMICCGALINYSLMDAGVIAMRSMDAECKTSRRQWFLFVATFLSCVFAGLSVDCPHGYVVALGIIPFIICMALMHFVMPVAQLAHPPHIESFLCPSVPYLPFIGILFNVVMLVQLGIAPLVQVIVWLLLGSGVYFAYGIRHSKLNFTNPNDRFYY